MKTTGKRQESGREATGSDRHAVAAVGTPCYFGPSRGRSNEEGHVYELAHARATSLNCLVEVAGVASQ